MPLGVVIINFIPTRIRLKVEKVLSVKPINFFHVTSLNMLNLFFVYAPYSLMFFFPAVDQGLLELRRTTDLRPQ